MKASYRKVGAAAWEGVLKNDAGTIVWSCGHAHTCRDYNHSKYYAHLGSAMDCSKAQLRLLSGLPVFRAPTAEQRGRP